MSDSNQIIQNSGDDKSGGTPGLQVGTSANGGGVNITQKPLTNTQTDPSIDLQNRLDNLQNKLPSMPGSVGGQMNSTDEPMNQQNQPVQPKPVAELSDNPAPQTSSPAPVQPKTTDQSVEVAEPKSMDRQDNNSVGANIKFEEKQAERSMGDPIGGVPIDQVRGQIMQQQISTENIDQILEQAIAMEVSDVHLNVGHQVVVRIDGELVRLQSNELSVEDIERYANQIVGRREDVELAKEYELDISYELGNRRFRVNIYRQRGELSIASRLIPERIKPLDELGLPMALSKLTRLPQGFILLTGPTGSGKSTTISSLLQIINKQMSRHIITLEDPIELIYPKGKSLIDQREFGVDFNNWDHALRATLRQDPDVVLLGEMRDYTTIASAITTAETGHLVFATLHTNSAAQSIDRMIDVFPEAQQAQIRLQLANVISAVVSQRLVVRADGSGRIAVAEVMIANPAVRSSIREGKTHQIKNIIQTSNEEGMMTLEQALARMINNGEITEDVGYAATPEPDQLELILNS